jgi:quinol monooxygenase YgiN
MAQLLPLHPAAPQEDTMYARMIQLTAKSGQGKDLSKVMQERALPLLKQQPGFVDALALHSDTAPDQFVGITIWKSKEDADKYLGGQAGQVLESIKPLLDGEPAFRTFNVAASVSLSVGVGRAASSS